MTFSFVPLTDVVSFLKLMWGELKSTREGFEMSDAEEMSKNLIQHCGGLFDSTVL